MPAMTSQYFNQFDHLNRVDSTQRYALDACQIKRMGEGGVVIADDQYLGVGRKGVWEMEPKEDLVTSFVITTTCSKYKRSRVLMAWILAVQRGIQPFVSEPVTIKWPNDLLIKHNKLCGLIAHEDRTFNRLIVGMGVNVDAKQVHGRCGVRTYNKSVNRWDVLQQILHELDAAMPAIQSGRIDVEAWNRVAAYMNEPVSFEFNRKKLTGRFCGIHENGGAVIDMGHYEEIIMDATNFRLLTAPVIESNELASTELGASWIGSKNQVQI